MAKRYTVVGGEYADTSFTEPAPGTQLEVHGPFNSEREAKVCWRELTGKTVDNAMVRYFLKAEDETSGGNYWVVGGEYADSSFTRLAAGAELQVFGPFPRAEAVSFWRGLTARSVDDALVRYDIRENYDSGDTGIKRVRVPKTTTRSVTVAVPPRKLFDFLMDARNLTQWASHRVKSIKAVDSKAWDLETVRGTRRLTISGDAASGTVDYTLVDARGLSWVVPGRVVPAGATGAVYVVVAVTPSGISEDQFRSRITEIDGELAQLKRVVEAG